MKTRTARPPGIETPWGQSDSCHGRGPGITFYGTPSHGGFLVEGPALAKIPEPFRSGKIGQASRTGGRWYEEDCEAAIVMHFHRDRFEQDPHPTEGNASYLARAAQTVKDYYPDAWTAATGEALTPADSHTLRRRAFYVEHAGSWVTISAFGDWCKTVPAGLVGVIAWKGGRGESYNRPNAEERAFIVPQAEYDARSPEDEGFVCDPARHAPWCGPNGRE